MPEPGSFPGPQAAAWKPGPTPPTWWPSDEAWPPRRGGDHRTWTGLRRRVVRWTLIWFALVIVVPLLVGVVLATAVGGWTSVAIALVSWVGLAIVLAAVVGSGIRWWRPVRSLIETAGRLAEGDYGARVDSTGRAPLRPVVHSFNRMAERLERAESERRRLLADVGHELRTPLTIIRGELEAMADGVHEPDEDELRRLLGDVDVMERLLDDLATLSTTEAGMLSVHREPTDVVRLVGEVVDGKRPEAETAGVALALAVGPESSEVDAEVDPVRVREIVANVVANALRATPAGGRVDVQVERSDDTVVIEVADTGRGIPADELERVFDRFHKGPSSGGSGLGLTISRNLAQAHGGDIAIDSAEGRGTVVTVSLPAAGTQP